MIEERLGMQTGQEGNNAECFIRKALFHSLHSYGPAGRRPNVLCGCKEVSARRTEDGGRAGNAASALCKYVLYKNGGLVRKDHLSGPWSGDSFWREHRLSSGDLELGNRKLWAGSAN
jgi:hypothetical protein